MSIELIREALKGVIDPELRLPITELGMVGEIALNLGAADVEIKLTITACPAADRIKSDVEAALGKVPEITTATVRLTTMTQAERDALKLKLRGSRGPKVNPFGKDTLTNIFLIGSGKGGVGKSTLTANLAVALANSGLRVGLIDADIFGFSIPDQLGIASKPTRVDELILPPVAFGVKVISIGMFLEKDEPVAWRGPMLHRAIEQFLTDVYWGDLDVLLVDLPPGTGDVAISIGQLLPTAKSVVVTTPQVSATKVAKRSGQLGIKTGQPILGVIENMSYLDQAGQRIEIFGSGGGSELACSLSEEINQEVKLLGQIPLSQALREGSDSGLPLVATNSKDAAKEAIEAIAKQLAAVGRELAGRKLPLQAK